MAEKKEEIKQLSMLEKLFIAQQHLVAPKNQYNSFGKYKYRSCEDIFEGLKPVLSTVRAVVKVHDEIVLIGDRFYIKAVAEFIDAETGEIIINQAFAREEENKKGMDSSQVTGAASSYARKYALNGLFGIDDTKDADSMDNTKEPQQKEQKQAAQPEQESVKPFIPISNEQIKALTEIIVSKGFSVEKVYPNGFAAMSQEKYNEHLTKWQSVPEKKGE